MAFTAIYVVFLMIGLFGLRWGLVAGASLGLRVNITITIDAAGDYCVIGFTREMMVEPLAGLSKL